MFQPFIQALVVASIFYFLLPVLGAFQVRRSWRNFRRLMTQSARSPFLNYGLIREGLNLSGGKNTGSGKVLGSYRLFGSIEAMEGKDRLWIRSLKLCGSPVSVSIDMRSALLYSLPGDGEEFELRRNFQKIESSDYDETAESPERLMWRSLPSLPEKTKVYVFGKVYLGMGKAEFRGNRKDPAIVLIYEGREDSLLSRCVRQGRQANEYWNRLTPLSFLTGAMGMVLILLALARAFALPLVRLLASLTAFLPLMIFLPPGLFFFFLYRAMWKRARSLRASRDMTRLPCEAFAPGQKETILPDGEKYLRVWVPADKPGKVALPGDLPSRGLEEWRARDGRIPGFTCFGAPDPERPGRLVKPKDPLADFTAIPGIPEAFSKRCSSRAHRYTLAAGLSLGLAALTNYLLLFFVLRRLL
jgi:hypothetical protein